MTNGEYMVCIREFDEDGFLEKELDERNGWSKEKALEIMRKEADMFLEREDDPPKELRDYGGECIYVCRDGRMFMAYIKAVI